MNQKRFSDDIDIKIKDCLKNTSEEISINENMFNKIKGGITMKKTTRRFKLKTALIAAAICATATVTCIASVKGGMWFGSSSLLNELYEMPNESVLNNKVGFVPKYVDYFEGGFKFESFNFANETYKDESGKEAYKGKSAHFTYKRDNTVKGQTLSLLAKKIDEDLFKMGVEKYKEAPQEYKGYKIYYNAVHAKYVPEDYEPNKEEEELMNKGLLTISYGTDKVEESNNKFVCWYEDGIEYSILNMGYDDVSKEQMIKMAQSVIDK